MRYGICFYNNSRQHQLRGDAVALKTWLLIDVLVGWWFCDKLVESAVNRRMEHRIQNARRLFCKWICAISRFVNVVKYAPINIHLHICMANTLPPNSAHPIDFRKRQSSVVQCYIWLDSWLCLGISLRVCCINHNHCKLSSSETEYNSATQTELSFVFKFASFIFMVMALWISFDNESAKPTEK